MRRASVLVLAPHPDDEGLACAGVLARAGAADPQSITVVVLTDGDAHVQACAYFHCRRAALQDLTSVPLRECLESQGMAVQEDLGLGANGHESRLSGRALQFGAIRFLARKAGQPKAWVAVFAADGTGQPVAGAQVEADDQMTLTNEQGYGLLEQPLLSMHPRVTVTIGDQSQTMDVSRTLDRADRRTFALRRRQETRMALGALGLPERAASFWNYPDQGLAAILAGHTLPGGHDRGTLTHLIRDLLDASAPDVVYLPSERDADTDHRAVHDLAMTELKGGAVRPEVRTYIIHPKANHDQWPPPPYRAPSRASRYDPNRSMATPPNSPEPDLRLALDGPLKPAGKVRVLESYQTQMAADDNGFLLAFAKQDEIFWRECMS